jgi:glucan 1,3-beta-glucosidase
VWVGTTHLYPTQRLTLASGIILGVSVVLLIIIISVAVVVSQKKKNSDDDSGSSSLDDKDRSDIPDKWKNTYLDPWSWETTEGFNTTFTDEMVGDLPVMGLNMDWDDSVRANDNVPPLDEDWGSYEKNPARGVNVGGWLSLEPFITPSLFDYPAKMNIVDEWSLCRQLGPTAREKLEKHYASFITEDDFKSIAEAGLDHVRIPFSYWAVETYDGDPYVFRVSWRYLLRGIEWARKYGLRVNLDVHGLPGSQNGWNHSGKKGTIGWLKGTDGKLNADRSHDIHDRLSKFFAQDRYKNIITHYGLANEPRMTDLKISEVIDWTEKAYKIIRDNGVKALAVFGDGFMGLEEWQGLMTGYDDMALDVHQYVIFNDGQLGYTHKEKVDYACEEWSEQTEKSMDRTTGYGPTLFAEWSQADTDCQELLNGGVRGARWDGTHGSVDGPKCPAGDSSCSCTEANGDPEDFSDEYKRFLKMFGEAQMHSFEKGLGWWYWTWKTESAPLWSYQAGLEAGLLPEKAYEREFNCDSEVPDFGDNGLSENY